MGIRSTLRQFKRNRIGLHGRTPCAAKYPHLYLNSLGLVCVVEQTWCIHLAVRPKEWTWGWASDATTQVCSVGVGPLFLLLLNCGSD